MVLTGQVYISKTVGGICRFSFLPVWGTLSGCVTLLMSGADLAGFFGIDERMWLIVCCRFSKIDNSVMSRWFFFLEFWIELTCTTSALELWGIAQNTNWGITCCTTVPLESFRNIVKLSEPSKPNLPIGVNVQLPKSEKIVCIRTILSLNKPT